MSSTLSEVARPLGAGCIFGAALTASRVYLPSVIINQMRFSDFHMLEVFLIGSASSAIIIHSLDKLGIAKKSVRSNSTLNWFSRHDGNLVGGALLGAGMSLTGACPGTVLPQLALAIPSSLPTAVGALSGGAAYALFGEQLARSPAGEQQSQPKPESHSIASKLSMSPQMTLLAFEIALLAVASISSMQLPGKAESMIPTVAGGLLIGLSQAASILLTSSPLGVSGAYEQLGRYLLNFAGLSSVSKPQGVPRPLVFACGILVGSIGAGRYFPVGHATAAITVSAIQGLVGGFMLVFGARVAGGCTSGHGISGLSSLSYPSLLTTAAMFAGGALLQLL